MKKIKNDDNCLKNNNVPLFIDVGSKPDTCDTLAISKKAHISPYI